MIFIFPYANKIIYLFYQPLVALSMKWLITLTEIIGYTVLRKQVKNLFSTHPFGCPIFFNAE